jgi:hypothetical protein
MSTTRAAGSPKTNFLGRLERSADYLPAPRASAYLVRYNDKLLALADEVIE